MSEICRLSAALQSGQTSSKTLVDKAFALLARYALDHAALECFKADADRLSEESDTRLLDHQPRSALEGIPFAIKANIAYQGHVCSCGSLALKDYVSPYTATVVRRLLAAGAIPICSSNMDEFAMGSTGENSAFGAVRNPHDQTRAAGGSSSGSAALVARGIVPFALGSDTGGSVRLPAAHCGVCGFKPTYGALSRYGLTAYASSLDQIGLLAQSADDIEAALRIMAGKDPLDATSFNLPDAAPVHSVRFARVANLADGCASSIQQALSRVAARIAERFSPAEDITLPDLRFLAPAYYVLAAAEASANLARFDGIRYGAGHEAFGAEVKKRIQMGEYVLSRDHYASYYQRAKAVQQALCAWFDKIFAVYDYLILPVSPTTAPLLGAAKREPVRFYEADVMTTVANLAGLPAISIPAGKDGGHMPIGVQLLAPKGHDYALLHIAQALLEGGEGDA